LALAACGSDDNNDDSKKAAATTASKSSEDKSADKSQDKDADKDKDKNKDKDKDKDGENKDGAAGAEGQDGEGPDQMANPLNNGEDPFAGAKDIKPIEGGQDANDADKQAIEQLVRGQHEIDNVKEYFNYMPQHACQAVREGQAKEFGQYQQYVDSLPNQSFAEYANTMRQQGGGNGEVEKFASQLESIPQSTKLQSVNDIVVNGDDASATVSVSNSEGNETSTVRFRRENGNWTFCN
jgi:putative secreted protein